MYTGPLAWEFQGDLRLGAQYKSVARSLLGAVKTSMKNGGLERQFASRVFYFSNGVKIRVAVFGAIHKAWIEVPATAQDSPFRALQYQFVYIAPAGETWPVFNVDGVWVVGGSAVGALFLLFDDGSIEHAFFPLVSTEYEPPNHEWVYLNPIDPSQWIDALPVPRYEIVHATSQHIEYSSNGLIHAPWIPKGNRHYMASAFSLSGLSPSGALQTNLVTGGSFDIQYLWDFQYSGAAPTDVGYEAPLSDYEPPVYAGKKATSGGANLSVPDTDWYTSYGIYTATSEEYGERRFGVAVDASQRVYVWPLAAAGTESPDPIYSGQLIKTNVHASYVYSQDLIFPSTVRKEGESFRDNYGDIASGESPFFGSTIGRYTRYVWYPNREGSQFVTIVEEAVEPQHHTYRLWNAGFPQLWDSPVLQYSPVAFDSSSLEEYRVPNPRVATFNLSVVITGEDLDAFSAEITPVELLSDDPSFFPVQARYACEGAYSEVDVGELVVGGFSIQALDGGITSHALIQHFEGDEDIIKDAWGPTGPALAVSLGYSASAASGVPHFPWLLFDVFSYDALGDSKFWAKTPARPYYAGFDGIYTQLTKVSSADEASLSGVSDTISSLARRFTLQAEFSIRAAEKVLFKKTVRKYQPNLHSMANWFTAQISGLDVSTGSVVLGICESTTETTCSQVRVPPYTPGDSRFPNFENEVGTNTSLKSHVVYYKSEKIESTATEAQEAILDAPIITTPISKSLRFWGTAWAGAPGFLSGADGVLVTPLVFNEASFELFLDTAVPALSTSMLSKLSHVGFRQFPWGLEMHSWVAGQHYVQAPNSNVVANDELFSFAGWYPGSMSWAQSMLTGELTGQVTVSTISVDIFRIGGQAFTHKEMFETAYSVAASFDFDIEIKSRLGFYMPVEVADGVFSTFSIYNALAVSKSSGVDKSGFFLEAPQFRVYCGINDFEVRYVDLDTGGGMDSTIAAAGSREFPIQARAYGYIDTGSS